MGEGLQGLGLLCGGGEGLRNMLGAALSTAAKCMGVAASGSSL